MPPPDVRENSPYAPWSVEARPAGEPRSSPVQDAPVPGPASEPPAAAPAFTFETAWSLGSHAFRRRYGVLLGAGAIGLGVTIAIRAVEQIVLSVVPPPAGQLAAFVVGTMLQLLVSAPILAGVLMLAVRAARGGEIRLREVLAPYARLETIIAISVLTTLITLALSLPLVAAVAVLQATGGAAPAVFGVLLGSLITLAAYALILSRLSLAVVAAVDPAWLAPGPVESLKIAWRLTDRAFWPFVAVWVTACLACGFSVLMFGVGVFFVGVPLMVSVQGAAYALLVAGQRSGRCARCGCSLIGLPSRTCPECSTVAPRLD